MLLGTNLWDINTFGVPTLTRPAASLLPTQLYACINNMLKPLVNVNIEV